MKLTNVLRRSSTSVAVAISALVLMMSTVLIAQTRAAGSASISFGGVSSVEENTSFTVPVVIDTGAEETNSATVVVSYSGNVSYLGVQSAAQPYEAQFGTSTSGSTVSVTRGSFDANVSGSATFMVLEFSAAGAGSAEVSVASGSSILRASDGEELWNSAANSKTITITAAPTTEPGDGGGSGGGDSGGSGGDSGGSGGGDSGGGSGGDSGGGSGDPGDDVTPDPPTDEPPTDGEDPEVERAYKKAFIKLRTNTPVRAKVLYGVDGSLDFASAETELTQNPRVAIDPALIEPGRTYSYKVILTDEQGNVTETDVRTFRATGFRVKLVVKDSNGTPLKRTKVILRSEPREGTTDDNGEVIFEDVEFGEHTATFEVNGVSVTQTLTVEDNIEVSDNGDEIIPLQVKEVLANSASTSSEGSNLVLVGVAGAGLLALLGGLLYTVGRRNGRTTANAANVNATETTQADTIIRPDNDPKN